MEPHTRSVGLIGSVMLTSFLICGCNITGPGESVTVEGWVVDPLGAQAVSRPRVVLSQSYSARVLAEGVADVTGHFVLSGATTPNGCGRLNVTVYRATSPPYAALVGHRSFSECGEHSVTIPIPWTFHGLADADAWFGLTSSRFCGMGLPGESVHQPVGDQTEYLGCHLVRLPT